MAEQRINWLGTTYIKLHLTFVWVCLAAIIVGILIYKFAYASPENRAVYVFIASALGLFTGAITLLVRLYQRERQLEQARRTTAFDFALRWTAPKFYDTRRKGREIYKELKNTPNKSDKQQLDELCQDDEKWSNFIGVINFFEILGLAVHDKQADEETAKNFFRGIIVGYWNVFGPVIKARRAEQDNARLFHWFETLHDKWKI